MNPDDLSMALLDVVRPLAESRRAGIAAALSVADFPVDRPKNREHGDWSSNAALRFAKRIGIAPRELADEISRGLASVPGISKVEVAGPGFVNIRLDATAAGAVARTVVEAGVEYGLTNT